jgi:hypothetical protein
MRLIELVTSNKITEQAAPNIAQIVNFMGNQNPGLKAPSVQNALTQFLNNNPDLARQAAANMNTAPGANVKINPGAVFRGLLGKAFGAVGGILSATPAGEGSEYLGSPAQIAYEFQQDLLKNNPQAYVDMVNSNIAGMSEVEKKQIEDGNWPDPRSSDQFKAAEEAARMLGRTNTAPAAPQLAPTTQPDWWPEDMPFDPSAEPEIPTVPSTEPPPDITVPTPLQPAPSRDTPPVIVPAPAAPEVETPPAKEPKPDVAPTGPAIAPPTVVKPPTTVPGTVTLPQGIVTPRTGAAGQPKPPGGKNGKNRRKLKLPSIGGGASTALKSIKPTLLQINDPLNLKRNIQ